MATAKVKICGVTTADDALAACEAGADALGFNFAAEAKSRNRYIDPEGAEAIIAELPPFVVTVGIVVNQSVERIRELLEIVDRIQLHGEEPPEVCNAIGARAIRAFRVGGAFDPAGMLAHRAGAYLLDALAPGSRGGTGQVCDWAKARRAVALERPIILAGGLTPSNVGEAIRAVRPYAVDTAGGVERAPGVKDHDRIRAFIRNAKSVFLP